MFNLFGHMLHQVKRLLSYPDWLSIERCQISFYCEKLLFLSTVQTEWSSVIKRYSRSTTSVCQSRETIVQVCNLVTRLLTYKYSTPSPESLQVNDPPNLNELGKLLGSKLEEFYKASRKFHEYTDDCGSPNFDSEFYFDKEKFQEYEREFCVGYDVEASNILKRLVCITTKKLEVISIVGMAGLGKTTLARKIYNDPLTEYHFFIRAWVGLSQVYQKRDLMLSILKSVMQLSDEVCRMDASMLAQVLYRALRGKRYLIFLDDVWSMEAWDDFKKSFPNDNNGSKIMLTTRLKDVALYAESDGNPLCLRFLTEDESFTLFQKKASLTGVHYDKLSNIGKKITRNCRGLPLAIVVIAGLLKNNCSIDWWEQVAESVSSYIVNDEEQYLDTLALSYNHMPHHLRPCFLYFVAFPENYDIPVSKLIRLWIAQGFVCQDKIKSLEDTAEDYLMDLISRSLISVSKKGVNGATKTCRIHDLLRDLCMKKAAEESFAPNTYKCIKHFSFCAHFPASYASSVTNPLAKSQLRPTTDIADVSSDCSCHSSEFSKSILKDIPMTWEAFELLRALDLSYVELFIFPCQLLQLVSLRYLELRFRNGGLPETICHLTKLETLIISSRRNMVVPEKIWKVVTLRHLCIKSGENLVRFSCLDEEPSILENLQTMSLVSPTRPCEHILARTPNLRKLGFCGPLTTKVGDLKCPDLGHLNHLETLKLLNTTPMCNPGEVSSSVIFPETLKRLVLSNTTLGWKEAWIFEMIPNLEVLKLKCRAFVGNEWETGAGIFLRLKFLKLDGLDIVTWRAPSNHFTMLQRLEVHRCPSLLEIPADFGNIYTLELIELSKCSDAAVNSARDIQKEQQSTGNDCLKILLDPGLHPIKTVEQRPRCSMTVLVEDKFAAQKPTQSNLDTSGITIESIHERIQLDTIILLPSPSYLSF